MHYLYLSATGYTNAVPTDKNDIITGSLSGATAYMVDYDNTKRIWTIAPISGMFGVGDVCSIAPGGTGAGTVIAPAIDVYITDKSGGNAVFFVCTQWRERLERPIVAIPMPTIPGATSLTGSWALDLGRLKNTVELMVVWQSMDDYFVWRGKFLGVLATTSKSKSILHIGTKSWNGGATLTDVVSNMEAGEDFLMKGTIEFFVGTINGNIDW